MNKYSPYDDAGNQYGKLKPKGGTRKIADIELVCSHPEHFPPTHQVFPNGVYEHVCPACGHTTMFTVSNPTL